MTRVDIDMEMLIQIWMDGMLSGAATALGSMGAPIEAQDILGQDIAEMMREDPAAMLSVEHQIRERLLGIDTGDTALRMLPKDGAV